jgi:hAT family C-terminal dimerisation region
MAITIFTIPPMSAGPERVFSGSKHTIAPERIRLGATMVERTECLKSWISITPGRQQAPLSGVFVNSRFVDEAINLLQKDLDDVDRD